MTKTYYEKFIAGKDKPIMGSGADKQMMACVFCGDISEEGIVHKCLSPTALEKQVGGNHYQKLAIQPMEYSMKNNLNSCQHTIVKYVTRYKDKNGIEDLKKAIHCIEMLMEFEYGKSKGYNE